MKLITFNNKLYGFSSTGRMYMFDDVDNLIFVGATNGTEITDNAIYDSDLYVSDNAGLIYKFLNDSLISICNITDKVVALTVNINLFSIDYNGKLYEYDKISNVYKSFIPERPTDMITFDNKIYVSSLSGKIYEWNEIIFTEVLNLGEQINCMLVNNNILYAGTEGGNLHAFNTSP